MFINQYFKAKPKSPKKKQFRGSPKKQQYWKPVAKYSSKTGGYYNKNATHNRKASRRWHIYNRDLKNTERMFRTKGLNDNICRKIASYIRAPGLFAGF